MIYKHTAFTKILTGLAAAFVLTLGFLALTAPQAVRADGPIYVDKDAPGPIHDGLSWTTAFIHPQTALDSAAYGGEIWVAGGVYTPTRLVLDFGGPCFFLHDGVSLYGGFGGYGISETLRTDRDWNAHLTILSGDLEGDDLTNENGIVTDTTHITGTNTALVVYSNSDATVDGFVITAGKSRPYANGGGGILNDDDALTLNNLTIIGNQAQYGGGIDNLGSLVLTNVLFSHNRASMGGGLHNDETCGDVKLDMVTFRSNYQGCSVLNMACG